MKFDFVVLGSTGMQGKIVSRDLLERGYSVLMCGRDKKRDEKILNSFADCDFEYFDARDVRKTAAIIKKSGANVAINCVEGDWNFNIFKSCIMANVHYLDLGSEIWMTKKQISMNSELKRKGLIGITGCGSVPGIGNVMLRYASEKFDSIDTIEAGFSWDSNIKKFVVPFSIQSILWEFTQKAPTITNGKLKKFTPLETIRDANHTYIGKQIEFLVEHPEPYTFYHYFKKKGVRNVRFYAGFPQHSFEKIVAMIDIGLNSYDDICFEGKKIVPVDFLTQLLKYIKMPEGYTEKENLWVSITGKRNGKEKKILMECLVPTLRGWEDAGCNIDTGIPASIMAQMIKKGIIAEKGSFAPEGVVPPLPFFKELRKRQMKVFENGKSIN
jgi:lysine 6-dehydrogenase